MKGKINYYGKDRVNYVLFNSGGNDRDSVASADERIATYGMQGIPRVRAESEQLDRDIPALFGHFGYGSIVIDAAGNLRGANLSGDEVASLLARLAQLTGPAETGTRFAATTKLTKTISGRPGFSASKSLTRPMTATVQIELKLPEGHHLHSGAGTGSPTVQVAYADRVHVGEASVRKSKIPPGDAEPSVNRVYIDLPIEIAQGTPIGQYFLHGTLTFTPSNAEGSLSPMELRWHAKVPAL